MLFFVNIKNNCIFAFMGAPKNNQFWKLHSKHGRDKIFNTPEIMWDAACEYFQYVQENPFKTQEIVKYRDDYEIVELSKIKPFTIQGLCIYLGVNTKYFNDFYDSVKDKDDEISKAYSDIITRIRETIYHQKFEGAASGFFNHNIIARDLGLVEKTDHRLKAEINKVPEWLTAYDDGNYEEE